MTEQNETREEWLQKIDLQFRRIQEVLRQATDIAESALRQSGLSVAPTSGPVCGGGCKTCGHDESAHVEVFDSALGLCEVCDEQRARGYPPKHKFQPSGDKHAD